MAQIQWHLRVTAVKNEIGLYTLMYAHMYRVNVDDFSREDRFAVYTLHARFDQLQVRNATVIEIVEDEYAKQFELWGHMPICVWVFVGVYTVRWSELTHGAPHDGELLHTQMHQIGVPPPPSVSPPPVPPVPTPIIPPRPPIEEPLVPEQPPLQPPPPPTLPDRPPRKPPIGRLYPSGDYAVWNQFVAKWGDRVGRWALEVPISRGLELQLDEEWQRKMVQAITTHKIDFIIEWGRVFYMGEIKPRGSISALGAALIQWQMANKMYRFDKLTRPALICATISPILLPIASQNGIVVFVTEGLDTEFGARVIEI